MTAVDLRLEIAQQIETGDKIRFSSSSVLNVIRQINI